MSSDGNSRSWQTRLARILGRPVKAAPADADRNGFAANVLVFDQMQVADVMVPRADIVGIEVNTPLGELIPAFAEASHSRLPIYRETLDDPLGVAHIKDVMAQLVPIVSDPGHSWADRRILKDIRRPLLFAPPSMRAIDLLLRMQARRMHLALVVDEYGGTDGLVTLEDLLEPIVGDIEDEHDDEAAPGIVAKGNGVWVADARATIEELEQITGHVIHEEGEDDDIDTLGGLVFIVAGRIPERGEMIFHPAGFEFEVLDADPRRIKRLRVRKRTRHPGGDEGAWEPA
ncbi:MAG: magnesium/cobalt efflux protein [Rhodobacterales bacterium CG15_BIG_FIL_POST_REV_8_21_14_020_59_13]|nr:MAG: magnesium/cobalt efflux protein [Rhodobacterales bacterium CG15_BIG_FIL_POST_REV_8_21_14_020_59_13]